jgi:hypothetical protein
MVYRKPLQKVINGTGRFVSVIPIEVWSSHDWLHFYFIWKLMFQSIFLMYRVSFVDNNFMKYSIHRLKQYCDTRFSILSRTVPCMVMYLLPIDIKLCLKY